MKILVTGANGFIGSNLVPEVVTKNVEPYTIVVGNPTKVIKRLLKSN